MVGRLFVGTSGYRFAHWQPAFYPAVLPRARWFSHYASQFHTVEIRNTFYRLPEPATFAAWRSAAPPEFTFALQFSRYASHFRRLRQPQLLIDTFVARAAGLGDRLGPILVQLPADWEVNLSRLAEFLVCVPRAQRWAFEFRDPRWLCAPVFALLREHGAALCVHDAIEPHPHELTTDWTYLRLHGGPDGSVHAGRLAAEATRAATQIRNGIDVFAFFTNDAGARAVEDARRLRALIAAA